MFEPGPEGSLPASGPFPYTACGCEDARRSLAGPPPPRRRWFHATRRDAALAAARYGLLPSCWRGGDCCVVCGHDALGDVHPHQGRWVLEIESPALHGQLKSWWVPPAAIRGAWHANSFLPATEMRSLVALSLPVEVGPCHCELNDLVEEQIAIWRSLHLD